MNTTIDKVLISAFCLSLSAAALADVQLSGKTLAGASITLSDSQAKHLSTTADAQGNYKLNIEGLSAPLMLVAETSDKQFVSIVPSLAAGTANINALTDQIASDVAQEFKFVGPVGLAKSGKAPAVSVDSIKAKTAALRVSLAPALQESGLDANSFDPLSAPVQGALADILAILGHNRGYEPKSGERADTSLYDPYFREVTRFAPFSLKKAQADLRDINAKDVVRVFIAGDSTASNYDPQVLPRMGWGQVFQRKIKDGAAVRVVNVAQSGRSSRSFINEGWFGMIAANIRKGDYLLVQFGHNDEKCGNNPVAPPPARDGIDIANLCTYPGNSADIPAEMSFRKTLEKYIKLAQDKGATPVLITPVTRRSFKSGQIGGTTHTYSKGLFPGDYSQTIRDTAQANKVALVDLDARSMAFFNQVGEEASLDYYLAVDTTKYPYYVGLTGARNKPDNTHFQERGAETVAGLVADGLREAGLPLAKELKP
ncbi:GDSL-type esterase/lipase family protein [Uliginosibacterium sediminicola]|uniref:GDSL-type esterase/lipase family protein n=1 Tax=Uliginosibacterium sediminicola TaxID=2024550 RepID=A0ABU9Z384_9RHOO